MSITFKSQDLRWADLRNSMTSLPKFNSLFTGLSPKTSKYEVLGVKTLTYEWVGKAIQLISTGYYNSTLLVANS